MSKEQYRPQQTRQPERNEPQYESPFSLKRDLREIQASYEKDPTLFAKRAMQALTVLLEETMPHAERRMEIDGTKSRAYVASSGYHVEKLRPYARLLGNVRQNGENDGYIRGLRTAFLALYEHITGEPAYLYPPGEEPAHLKPEEGGRQQP